MITTTRKNGSLRVQSVPEGKSRTEQSHQHAVNVNTIVAKARKGIPPRINARQGLYGDFSTGVDFHEMMNRINDAKLDFMSLPSGVRSRFGNDPGKLIDFISDPANREEAIRLNLLPGDLPAEAAPEAVERPPAAESSSEGTPE